MKNFRIIGAAYLILLLVAIVACQPSEVEDLEYKLESKTPVSSLQENVVSEAEEVVLPIVTPSPTITATSTAEIVATNTPTITQVPTGKVQIISEPEGALVSILNNSLSEETPVTWMLPLGIYTVTLTLAGYDDWIVPITVEASSEMTLTAILRQHHTIIPIEKSAHIWELEWSEDGQSLTYSMGNEQWPLHVQSLSIYQSWWRYDMVSSMKQILPSPQTRVSNTIREMLGICPFPVPEQLPYPCSSNLKESTISDRIVFQSEKLDSQIYTWLANTDGSDIIPLGFSDSPQDVIWSSDGQWLLIGIYWGGDGDLYTLVSSDGTIVENLEELTNTSHYRVQGPTPQFSPDGQKLAFVGIETGGRNLSVEQLDQINDYALYVLDLNTLTYQVVSTRLGLFHWADDGSGLYVLDGSAQTSLSYLDSGSRVLYTELYYIDLTEGTFPEQKLASDIPMHLAYSGKWAYSPEANAMAGIFDLDEPIFGILSLK
jgi:hypothetical protein